ncbi:MAG: bifunctional hydroxymethylpyrimidine kinase/phosphomethylpyrimidine kinase [Verrucomicrobiales bacterium]
MPQIKVVERQTRKIALTIAGSDSGGGAGIQADLKTFVSLGVHGLSAITCLTAQNPKEVLSVHPVTPGFLRDQLQALITELPPDAIKTGMLYSQGLIEAVVDCLSQISSPRPSLIVDPVMISTSGHELLKPAAKKALISTLFPHASLLTPNLDEARTLLKREIKDIEGLRSAAKELFETFGSAALMKGGHFTSGKEAVDAYYDGKDELLLISPFIRGISTHGTGCTYSAAIAANLAMGKSLPKAVVAAKKFVTAAIDQSYKAAKHFVLNHNPRL